MVSLPFPELILYVDFSFDFFLDSIISCFRDFVVVITLLYLKKKKGTAIVTQLAPWALHRPQPTRTFIGGKRLVSR